MYVLVYVSFVPEVAAIATYSAPSNALSLNSAEDGR